MRNDSPRGNADQRPNILILFSDQLRRQALSCYGDRDAVTPNIDKLAADGVRFSAACSTYPVCVPFRFTLMTGHYAHTRLVPVIEWVMSPAERTLADEFNEAGYDTIYIGKWHLDGGLARMRSARQVCLTPVHRTHQGRWQNWFGFELRNDPFDTFYFENDDPAPRRIEKYQTDGLFDIGMDYIANRRDRSKNFCMCISVEPPHEPFVAPRDLEESWRDRELLLPPNFQPKDERHRARLIRDRRNYYAMVENIDQNVGRMVDFLERQGCLENTVIIFLSDHGELNGSHGHVGKRWPYEESIGIPLIVRDPRHPERSGVVVDDPVCSEDLFPTLLGLAGLEPRDRLPGTNLSSLVHGVTGSPSREGIFLELVVEQRRNYAFYGETWRGFRTSRFKYTVMGDRSGAKPWQFFDLERDPYEQRNALNDDRYRDEIAEHHRLLAERIMETEDRYSLLPAFGQGAVNIPEIS